MKVLVIGDIIIDKYIYGTATRLSPEAPVPIVSQTQTSQSWGGAGLVYENLKSLGVDVALYDYDQPKSIKTRVVCDGHYVTRIDEDFYADGYEILEELQEYPFDRYDIVILSDYNKGVLDFSEQIIELANSAGCRIIVDPKRQASAYTGAWLVKPNRKEYDELSFSKWLGNIVTTSASKPVIAKIDGKEYSVSVDPVEVADVAGAGDCFLAAFVYGLTKSYDYKTCLKIAVRGSTASVKHNGTYILKIEDIEDKIVFTNGVFDILHKGHLELLKKARSLGSKLIVGINSDASVKRLKGELRPVNNQTARMEQLKALPWVDAVIIFDEDTPYETIYYLQPDLIVKGGDYTVDQVVGNDLAEVYIFPTIEGYSTTRIIEASK
jgi:D-beta-D-heptose 7-phosphate kinase/D-beta-D-heptose 1-phosphate adenosyltransferase